MASRVEFSVVGSSDVANQFANEQSFQSGWPAPLVILHSGQTGVERGAHRAARAAGLTVAGFCTKEMRDELGALPSDVLEVLTPHHERGPRQAVRANLMIASGALVVVPKVETAERVTAIASVLQVVRAQRLPLLICDRGTDSTEVARWCRSFPASSGSLRIAVTGPRETRWAEGEGVARRIVMAMAYASTISP